VTTDILLRVLPSPRRAEARSLGLPARLEGATHMASASVPYSSGIPAVLHEARAFVVDSCAYLKGLYSPWELPPVVVYHRDRMLTKVG
jgi:hypothetical protein